MSYQRFNKLPVEKRTKLLDIAAKEFAKYGFEDASVSDQTVHAMRRVLVPTE
jgi:AcrR family transcriptional regulator